MEKIADAADTQGVEAAYNKCLFSKIEADSISKDSASKGLRIDGLIDGSTNWCSEDTYVDHWVRAVFDQPVTLQELRLFLPYSSKNIHVFYQDLSGQDVEISDYHKKNIPDYRFKKSHNVLPETRWTFSPVSTQQLTVIQKAGGGSEKMPNQMCVEHIWAY